MVKNKIEPLIIQGKKIILDGFPNNLIQAQFLDDIFKSLQVKDACFIHLSVDPQIALDRILSRTICSQCKVIYNTRANVSAQVGLCDCCNGALVTRIDDNELCAQKRAFSYADASKPVLDYYKNQQRLIEIDGNQAIDQIFNAVSAILAITDISCFYVEGATGVGKTTFLELLGQNLDNVITIYKPVEKFMDVNGAGNILELFFTNPKRWTLATETYISLMHLQAAEDCVKAANTSAILVDRSMHADCYVYGKMAHRLGTMNLIEWEIYQQLISWIVKHTTAKPRGFIYLQASPQIALNRVRQRNGAGEEAVPLSYQENLNNLYQEWFIEKKEIPDDLAQIPELIIDATQNFKDDLVIQQQCVNQVKAFIKQIEAHSSN